MADQLIEDKTKTWRVLSVLLAVLSLVLLAIIIYLTALLHLPVDTSPQLKQYSEYGTVQLGEPSNPSVFHDLTISEIRSLVAFLRREESLNITSPPANTIDTNYRYPAELYLPSKEDVLVYLDADGKQPAREAIVTIFRGAKDPPDVIERIVGPLPNPTYIKTVPGRPNSVPFILRPVNIPEYKKAVNFVVNTIDTEFREFLQSVYGGNLRNCGTECLLMTYFSSMSPAVSGENTRKIWFWLSRDKEGYFLNNLDFAVLVNTVKFEVENIWFRGHTYDGVEAFKSSIMSRNISEHFSSHPSHDNSFSKAERRGKPFWDDPLRNPTQIEPDGKRYSVNYNHVTYMRWRFDFRMSSAYGPQLYDIRYDGQRIVYEIGLQEVCVFYSANNPAQMFADFFDSSDLLGPKASPLVPGVDCPSHATFIDSTFLTETSDEPFTTKHVFCVFELNTGDPHRRHYNYEPLTETSYEGMESVVLVFRTILTVMNYDYIFDFRFHQNGAVQVRILSTGFISTSFYRPEESPYAYRIHDAITGSLHHHLLHFKIDLDIMGVSNRFATLDIHPNATDNVWSKVADQKYHQTKFSHNLKKTELEAAYKYNFDSPKYLTFYNNKSTNKFGVPKSYRLLSRGMTKSLLKQGEGNEPSASWSRYQMAVTRRKKEERFSSSQFAGLDTTNPVVRFQDFLQDDESILDEVSRINTINTTVM